jgi:hypothetical protein
LPHAAKAREVKMEQFIMGAIAMGSAVVALFFYRFLERNGRSTIRDVRGRIPIAGHYAAGVGLLSRSR